jgi:hypothetical protein
MSGFAPRTRRCCERYLRRSRVCAMSCGDARVDRVVNRASMIFERDGKPRPPADSDAARVQWDILQQESNLEAILGVLAKQFVATAYVPSVVPGRAFRDLEVDAAIEDAIDNVTVGLENLHLRRGQVLPDDPRRDEDDDPLNEPNDTASACDTASNAVDAAGGGAHEKKELIKHFIESTMATCRAHCQPFTHPERAYMMKMVNEKSKATVELQRKLDASNRRLREMKERFEAMAGLQAELPVNTPSEHSRRNSGAGASSPAAPIVKMPTLQDVLAGVAQAQQSLVSPRSDGTPPQSVHGQLTGAPRGAKPAMSVAAAARLVSQMKLVTARTRFQRLQGRLQAVERARMADHDVAFLPPTNVSTPTSNPAVTLTAADAATKLASVPRKRDTSAALRSTLPRLTFDDQSTPTKNALVLLAHLEKGGAAEETITFVRQLSRLVKRQEERETLLQKLADDLAAETSFPAVAERRDAPAVVSTASAEGTGDPNGPTVAPTAAPLKSFAKSPVRGTSKQQKRSAATTRSLPAGTKSTSPSSKTRVATVLPAASTTPQRKQSTVTTRPVQLVADPERAPQGDGETVPTIAGRLRPAVTTRATAVGSADVRTVNRGEQTEHVQLRHRSGSLRGPSSAAPSSRTTPLPVEADDSARRDSEDGGTAEEGCASANDTLPDDEDAHQFSAASADHRSTETHESAAGESEPAVDSDDGHAISNDDVPPSEHDEADWSTVSAAFGIAASTQTGRVMTMATGCQTPFVAPVSVPAAAAVTVHRYAFTAERSVQTDAVARSSSPLSKPFSLQSSAGPCPLVPSTTPKSVIALPSVEVRGDSHRQRPPSQFSGAPRHGSTVEPVVGLMRASLYGQRLKQRHQAVASGQVDGPSPADTEAVPQRLPSAAGAILPLLAAAYPAQPTSRPPRGPAITPPPRLPSTPHSQDAGTNAEPPQGAATPDASLSKPRAAVVSWRQFAAENPEFLNKPVL